MSVLQVLAPPTPPAPTHHPTVIVPAPTLTQHPHHHVTVVTMSPSAHTSTVSTSRQNLDTIVQVGACFTLYRGSLLSQLCDHTVISQFHLRALSLSQRTEYLLQPSAVFLLCFQAIQHIERTQERRASAEEEQRRAVIVSPAHVAMDTACSDTDTDTEGEDCSMN